MDVCVQGHVRTPRQDRLHPRSVRHRRDSKPGVQKSARGLVVVITQVIGMDSGGGCESFERSAGATPTDPRSLTAFLGAAQWSLRADFDPWFRCSSHSARVSAYSTSLCSSLGIRIGQSVWNTRTSRSPDFPITPPGSCVYDHRLREHALDVVLREAVVDQGPAALGCESLAPGGPAQPVAEFGLVVGVPVAGPEVEPAEELPRRLLLDRPEPRHVDVS